VVELSKMIEPYLNCQLIIAPFFKGFVELDDLSRISYIRLKIPGIKILDIIHFPLFNLIIFSKVVAKKILELLTNDENIDIIHVHGPHLAFLINKELLRRGVNVPVVSMSHGYSNGLSNKIIETFFFKYPPKYGLILNDGNRVDLLESKMKKLSIPYKIVNHAIDLDYYSPSDNPKKSNFSVFFPHRCIDFKRPDLAIEAFIVFIKKLNVKEAILVIPDEEESCLQILNRIDKSNLKYIKFIGKQNNKNMVQKYRESDVVIATSLISNLNRSVQEAMSCGVPIIAFNCDYLDQIITDGECGFLITKGDIDEMASKLFYLYENNEKLKIMGLKARESIKKNRSWDKRIIEELDAYNTIVNFG